MNTRRLAFLLVIILLAASCGPLPQAPEPEPTRPPAAALANPASQNCVALGGKLEIEPRGDGGQFGVCFLEDNRQCEEWALLRGECPAGGVKVTGYVTPAARYCAITGGAYAATANAGGPDEQGACTLAGGAVCDAVDFYNGKCDASTGSAPAAPGPALSAPEAEVCNGMAQVLMEALSRAAADHLPVEVTQAAEPVAVTVWREAGAPSEGAACRAEARGTGKQFASPAAVLDAITEVMVGGGWKVDERQAAGGSTGAGAGFRSGDLIAFAGVLWLPDPAANCPADQPISACKLLPKQQLYTVTLDTTQTAMPGTAGIANPASQGCRAKGGTLRLESRPDGAQFGVCNFGGTKECEEWALLRGECPAGGVDVSGLATPAARFCVISGGQYDREGGCTFANGVKCPAEDFFAGTCRPEPALG